MARDDPAVPSCQSHVGVTVVWLSQILIILWASNATRRFTEMLNLTPSVMSGQICYEKVVVPDVC